MKPLVSGSYMKVVNSWFRVLLFFFPSSFRQHCRTELMTEHSSYKYRIKFAFCTFFLHFPKKCDMLWMWKVAVADTTTKQIHVAWNFDQRKGKTAKLLWLRDSKGQSCQGSAEGDSIRVGLLQQDDRPHPSHRLRPQGLSRTDWIKKSRKVRLSGFFVPCTIKSSWTVSSWFFRKSLHNTKSPKGFPYFS